MEIPAQRGFRRCGRIASLEKNKFFGSHVNQLPGSYINTDNRLQELAKLKSGNRT